jgi:hypothetical protein
VPSDLLILEDAQSIQIKKYFGSLAVLNRKNNKPSRTARLKVRNE